MLFDSHFHLPRLPQPKTLLQELLKINYHGESSACFPNEWEFQISLLKNISNFSQCLGVHPEIASKISPKDMEHLKEILLKNPEIAIGECGLDKRFDGYSPLGIQEKIFITQLQLACELDRKVVIHCVGDYFRLIKILKNYLPQNHPVYFHRYAGNSEITEQALYFNATFGNPRHKKAIPCERICFETDADEHFCQPKQSSAEIAYILKKYLEDLVKNQT